MMMNRTLGAFAIALALTLGAPSASLAGPAGGTMTGDFDGDGRSDLLLVDATDLIFWFMIEESIDSQAQFAAAANYTVRGVGNFGSGSGADAMADIVLQHDSTKEIVIWFMNGSAISANSTIGISTGYDIVAIGDFDNDKTDDLLLRNTSTGDLVIWFIDAATGKADWTRSGKLADLDTGIQVMLVGNFNGSQGVDLLLFRSSDSALFYWFLDGKSITGPSGGAGTLSTHDFIATRDVDGNGTDDIVLQLISGADVTTWFMSGKTVVGNQTIAFSGSADAVLLGTMQSLADEGSTTPHGGNADLVFQDGNGAVSIWFLEPDGTFRSGDGVSGNLPGTTLVTYTMGQL